MSCRRFRLPVLLVAASALFAIAASTAAAAGTITGTAYLDRNSNGVKDVGSFVAGKTLTVEEPGVEGVRQREQGRRPGNLGRVRCLQPQRVDSRNGAP